MVFLHMQDPAAQQLISTVFSSVSASCKTSHWMPAQAAHTDTSWDSFTEASPWPLLQHSSRDVTFSSTANSYWSSCSPQCRCSVPHTAIKLQWIQVARVWTGASLTVLGSSCRLPKSLELDIKRNKRANRVCFLCLIKKRLSRSGNDEYTSPLCVSRWGSIRGSLTEEMAELESVWVRGYVSLNLHHFIPSAGIRFDSVRSILMWSQEGFAADKIPFSL